MPLYIPETTLLGLINDNMAAPQNASEVRFFLAIVGYYRYHIPQYAKLAYPLVVLTKKYAKFVWGERGWMPGKPWN